MEKEWLKLEGGAIEDDLTIGQVRAVLPNPPDPSPPLWEDRPPPPHHPARFSVRGAWAPRTEESASTEPRAVGRASEGRLPELGVGGGVAGQGWEERQTPGRAANSWDARGVRERIGGRSASH